MDAGRRHGTADESHNPDSFDDGSEGIPDEPGDDYLAEDWRGGATRQGSLSRRGWRNCYSRLSNAFGQFKPPSFNLDSYQSVTSEDDHKSETVRTTGMFGPIRDILFASKLNLLLVFVPIGAAASLTDLPPLAIFTTNSIAIIPLSVLLTDATERIAAEAGETVGALLNVSLGNLVELILFIIALANGQTRVVESSILGSILVNILLILGSALLACSLNGADNSYNASGTPLLGSLLFVSVFVFIMPTTFRYTFQDAPQADDATLMMSRITSCAVLFIYVLYLIHELKSSGSRHSASGPQSDDAEAHRRTPVVQTVVQPPTPIQEEHLVSPLLPPPRTIKFAGDEDEEEEHEPHRRHHQPRSQPSDPDWSNDEFTMDESSDTGGRQDMHGPRNMASAYRRGMVGSQGAGASRNTSRASLSLSSGPAYLGRNSAVDPQARMAFMRSGLPTMRAMRSSMDDIRPSLASLPPRVRRNTTAERVSSVLVLIVSSALMSMNAEFLVSTIDEITHQGHLSEAMIGLIILPIVGNMAEYVTVVSVAVREKLDLAIAVSVGSSIQIALAVAPLTVLAGWIMDRDLYLTFNLFEMAILIGTVLLVNIIILSDNGGDSTSNALRGGLVCACYAIICIGAFLAPL